MMRKRFVPSSVNKGSSSSSGSSFGSIGSSFGSSSKSVIDWCSDNKSIVALSLVVVLAIVGIVVAYFVNEDFANTVSTYMPFLKKSGVKDLDIIFFFSPTCPWCQKMITVLEKEGTKGDFEMVDITQEDGQKLATKYGAMSRGVPNFVSRKTNTGTVGFKQSSQDIINDLQAATNPSKEQNSPQPHSHPEREMAPESGPGGPGSNPLEPINSPDIQNLGVVLFYSDSCGWCKRAKDDAEQLGIVPFLEMQDLAQGGQEMIQNLGLEFKGVPMFYSHATGKSAVGYQPWSKVVSMLSR